MAISVSQPFHRTSANPIDETMALTKAQMLLVNDNLMPQYYLTICQDDGAIYLYDKSATPSEECGKFHKLEAGENYVNNDDLGELIVSVYNPEKLDYAVDDYVIYLKKLYRCKVANTTNLPTVTTDWEQVNIIDTIDKKVNEHVPDLSNYVDNEDLGELVVELYDSTKADYAVDDYVIYQKKLYRCKTANTRNVPTNTTDWEKVNLIDTIDKKVNEHVPDLSNYVDNEDLGELVVELYDSTKADYAVDDYVIYQKKLYRCKTANTRNLPTNTTDWEKVNLIDTIDKKVNEHVPDLSEYVDNSDLGHLVVAVYSSSTYEEGDYCIHEKKFYQCNTTISTAEEWNASHWTEVNLVDVMDAKIAAIDLSDFLTEGDANKMIAANWVQTRAYAIDDYVLYEREVYRCKEAVSANTAWDSTKWDKVKLTNVFSGGLPGLVPAATVDDSRSLLRGDGTWMPYKDVSITYDSENEELHINFSGFELSEWTLSGGSNVTDSNGNNVEVATMI